MNLQDRIVKVLQKPGIECVWPKRRAVDRLWLDDDSIPEYGLRLIVALWMLQFRKKIRVRRGYVGLV
jgi:hypothetical protein